LGIFVLTEVKYELII